MFSSFIVWYLFLAGTGGGAFVFAVFAPFAPEVGQQGDQARLHARTVAGLFVAAFCMVLASLFLLADLGAPWDVWRIVFNPFFSVTSLGACAVTLLTLVAVVLAGASLLMPHIPCGLVWLTRTAGVLLAGVAIAYTGLLLAGMTAIDVWSTWLLPVLFVVSSLSCGSAALLFMEVFLPGKRLEGPPPWWHAQLALGMLEVVVLIAYLLERAWFSHTAWVSIELLIGGEHAFVFWFGVIALGLLVPMVVHALHSRIPVEALVPVASASVLVGGFLLRFCIVGIALYTPAFLAY